jgi:phage-related protein
MTQPAGPQSIVQQFVQPFTDALNQAATTFSEKLADSLTKQMEETTKAFKEAHPAIASVNDQIVGMASVAAQSAGAVALMSLNARDMIRNSRDLRREFTGFLDAHKSLDGIRLRLMLAADAARKAATAALQSAAAWVRSSAAAGLAAARTAVITTATKAWAVAQRVLNLVLALNPIGLIIAAIGLLVAGFVLAYQRSTTFRNIVNGAFNAVRSVVMAAFTVIRNAVTVVWPFIAKVIQVYVTIIRTVVTVVWRAIAAVVTTYITIVRTVVTTVFNAVRAVVTTVWNGIRAVISGAVSAVVRIIRGIGEVFTIVRDAFNRARSAVADAIGGIVTFVRGLPGRIVSGLGNIGRTLYQSGRDLIEGFIRGLRDMAGRVVSAIKEFILDKVPGPIKRFLGISSPSRVMAEIGRNIGEGLVAGIDSSRDMVAAAMGRLVPVPATAVIRPAVAALAEGTFTATVSGGRATGGGGPGAPVTVNVYPRAGQSEYEIGRVTARELAWAAKH